MYNGRWATDHGAEDPEARPGLAAEPISWLSERDIAVYSGGCFEALPSGYHDLYPDCT
jgi:hypothetical protein